jgi:CBS domain-containing protein
MTTTKVADIMTSRVIAVRENAGFKEIVAAMRWARISACPVVDDADGVIGILSTTDLLEKAADPAFPTGLRRLQWRLGEATRAAAVTAGQLMTAPAVTIEPDATVADAARLMQARGVRRLPVRSETGHLAGIVSRADVLSVFERPDEAIRRDVIREVIEGEHGLDPDRLAVIVASGIVTLTGTVDTSAAALHLLGRVRHAEGVVGIRDRLTYPPD